MPPRIKSHDDPPSESVVASDGHFKTAAPPAAPVGDVHVAISQEAVDDVLAGWRSMDDAPKDGTLIQVRDGVSAPGYAKWKSTRVRCPENRRWVAAGWWYNPFSGEPIKSRLILWRMPDGFNMPGMVV